MREKLIEILLGWGGLSDCAEDMADYLIANGVRLEEKQATSDKTSEENKRWIPVSERIPENFVSVLGYMTDAGTFPPVRECYTIDDKFYFPALLGFYPVSHWTHLPEPPKGDYKMDNHTATEEAYKNGLQDGKPKWISVENQLPEKGRDYLCRCNIDGNDEFPFYMVLRYILVDKNPHFQHECEHGLHVTHWMPLPEPPEEAK